MSTCPKCGSTFERRPNQFHWRGTFFHGLVCVPCNALWNDPDDSFEAAVSATPQTDYPLNEWPCPGKPEELKGQPIGMYHCEHCGEMQIAGMEHLAPQFPSQWKPPFPIVEMPDGPEPDEPEPDEPEVPHISEINWRAKSAWPLCAHGYYITPSHHCPWCAGVDTSEYKEVVGEGNGWLLKKDTKPCEDCGGPNVAGFGAFNGTPEEYEICVKTILYCYTCTMARRYNT